MKVKSQLFAGMLAVSLTASLAVPAFAAGDGNALSTDPIVGDLVLTKNYVVSKGTAPAEKLQFKVTYWKSENVVSGGVANAIPTTPLLYNADFTENGSVTGLTVGSHSKSFNIDMQNDLGLHKVGKYYFYVEETAGDMASVTYDSSTRILVVSVVNKVDDDGVLEDGLDYYAALYDGLTEDGEMGGKISGSEAFENKYGKDNDNNDNVFKIDLSKEVRGRFGDRDEEFTFDIVFTPEKGKNANDYYGATVVVDGTSYTWAIDGTTHHTITLKHGETVTIENLPEGVDYTITEDFSNSDWSTTADGVAGTTTDGTITADKDVDYVNTHNGVPDTGVLVDNAPYITLMAVAGAGTLTLFLSKRRHTEE